MSRTNATAIVKHATTAIIPMNTQEISEIPNPLAAHIYAMKDTAPKMANKLILTTMTHSIKFNFIIVQFFVNIGTHLVHRGE